MLNVAHEILINAFKEAGAAGGKLFVAGGKSVLAHNTKTAVHAGIERLTGESLVAGKVGFATKFRAAFPGGSEAVAHQAARQAVGAMSRAGAAGAVLGAGVAVLEVQGDYRNGRVSRKSAVEYVARQAGKGGAASIAGTVAIVAVASLTGPLAPLTCVALGTVVAIGSHQGLNRLEEDYFPQDDKAITAMKERQSMRKTNIQPTLAAA